MTPDQRLRLFAALLGEGRALVLAEAGETDRTLAWARNIDAALAEYRGEAKQGEAKTSETPVAAPPGFRVVGRSGPDVPRTIGQWVVSTLPGEVREPFQITAVVHPFNRDWLRGDYALLEPVPVAAPAQPVCPYWCGTKKVSHGEDIDHGPTWVETGDTPRTARCWCSPACRDAGRPLNPPPAEVPPECKFWCGGRWESHGDHPRGEYHVTDPAGRHCFCSLECRAAGRPLNPPAAVPPGQVAGEVMGEPLFTPAPAAPAKESEPAKVPLSETLSGNGYPGWATQACALEGLTVTLETHAKRAERVAQERKVERDAARAEVEQLRAKLADMTAALASSRQQIEAVTVDRRSIIDGEDARVLAMRDACKQAAYDAGSEGYYDWSAAAAVERIVKAIERLPVGAGEGKEWIR